MQEKLKEKFENSSPCPVLLSLRCATWTVYDRYPSQYDKFSARVEDQTNVLEAFPVIGTLSHNFQRSVGTICPSTSEELHARVHTTLVEYNYLDRVMFPFKSCDSFVLQVCNITETDHLSPDGLVGGSSTLTGQKTTSPLTVFHFSPHSGNTDPPPFL
jgi:hypothetical protein